MAEVTFTIKDLEDGEIDVSASADPYIPDPSSGEIPTPAQTIALIMLAAAQAVISELGAEIENADTGEVLVPAKPQLVVVGDTGEDASS